MGPGNFLVDKYMNEVFNEKYDVNGQKAFLGTPSHKIRSVFLKDNFFKKEIS